MSLLLQIVGGVVGAACVWTTVRLVNSRQRRAKVGGIGILAVLTLYPLGSGPAFWLLMQDWCPKWLGDAVGFIYLPLVNLLETKGTGHKVVLWYLSFWI